MLIIPTENKSSPPIKFETTGKEEQRQTKHELSFLTGLSSYISFYPKLFSEYIFRPSSFRLILITNKWFLKIIISFKKLNSFLEEATTYGREGDNVYI